MSTLSSEDGTNEDNTFDFEQQQQQQQQNNDYNKDNKQKKKALITKTSPQQDSRTKRQWIISPFVSKFTCRQQIR